MRHMGTLRERHPLHLRHSLEDGRDGRVGRAIVHAVREQRGDADLVQLGADVPGLDRACDCELRRPLPGKRVRD